MKKPTIVLIFCLLLTACGPGQIFGPTLTPTPTNTSTPTPTSSPTLTPTVTPSPTRTPRPTSTPSPTLDLSCGIKNGKWESNELGTGYLTGKPIITFTVQDCRITQIDLWVDFGNGISLGLPVSSNAFIQNQEFSYTNKDSLAEYTVEGTFDSEAHSHGTILFPKGQKIVLYTLQEDVIITWTAHPIE